MTSPLRGWIEAPLRVIGAVVREGWRRFLLLSLGGVVAYQLFLFSPFVVSGSYPNYFKIHEAWAGITESIQLKPPLSELWTLMTDQPIYEFGVQDRFGFISLQFVATTHALITMVLLPVLVALSLLLLTRASGALREPGGLAVGVGGISTSTLAGLFGASTSAVACCGASSGPVFLSLLGFGFGTAGAIVDHAEVLEMAGYALLVGNLLGLAGWIGRHSIRRCLND